MSAVLVTFAIVSCSDDANESMTQNQEINLSQKSNRPCPEVFEEGWERELETHRIHRASTGCLRGFSICRVFKIVRGCVPIGEQYNVISPVDPGNGTITVYSIPEVESNQIRLIFPKSMEKNSELINEDLSVFYVEDELLFVDFKVKTGAYPTIFKENTIEILIDLK